MQGVIQSECVIRLGAPEGADVVQGKFARSPLGNECLEVGFGLAWLSMCSRGRGYSGCRLDTGYV